MFKKFMDRLFPGSGDGHTVKPSLSAEQGAAGVLIEVARRDGQYTEVERDIATAAIMKLFHMDNASAAKLRQEAEEKQAEATTMMGFAAVARQLPMDKKEALITQLWSIADSDAENPVIESQLLRSIVETLGLSQERARSLRPTRPSSPKE